MLQPGRWMRIVVASLPITAMLWLGKVFLAGLSSGMPPASGDGQTHSVGQIAITALLSLVFTGGLVLAEQSDRRTGRRTVVAVVLFSALIATTSILARLGVNRGGLLRAGLTCLALAVGVLTLKGFKEITLELPSGHK
jgi:hypothetical protein